MLHLCSPFFPPSIYLLHYNSYFIFAPPFFFFILVKYFFSDAFDISCNIFLLSSIFFPVFSLSLSFDSYFPYTLTIQSSLPTNPPYLLPCLTSLPCQLLLSLYLRVYCPRLPACLIQQSNIPAPPTDLTSMTSLDLNIYTPQYNI